MLTQQYDCEGSQRQQGAVHVSLKGEKKDNCHGCGENQRRLYKLDFELTGSGRKIVWRTTKRKVSTIVKEVGQNIN